MMSDQAPEGITAHLTEAPGDPLILILVTTAGIQLDPLDALGWYSRREQARIAEMTAHGLRELADDLERKARDELGSADV
jgi:hypothetical protein